MFMEASVFIGMIVTTMGAVASALVMYRSRSLSTSKDVVALQKERIDLLEDKLKESDDRVSTLVNQVALFQGEKQQLIERIRSLEVILQNRNPEMEAFFHLMMNVIPRISEVAEIARTHIPFAEESFKKLLAEKTIITA